MEHPVALDMSLNTSQPGSGSSMNTSTKVSARKMNSKKGGTAGVAGRAKDDSITCCHCGQEGHISGICPNSDLMKKLLEQV